MDSSVEMNNFGQYYGESLMDAWYRMNGINKNGVNKHTPATLIRNFYSGLDGWSKCFLDSLTHGRFASGNPSHANNLMENLFGSSIETKDETGIKQLKVSIDKSILDLQNYVEECPTKNEIRSFILYSKTRMKKTNDTLSKIASRMEMIANNAKSKKGATKKFNDKIFSMLEPLDRDIKDYVEEEDDLQIALNASLKKRNEKLVWVKMKGKKVEKLKCLVKSRNHYLT